MKYDACEKSTTCESCTRNAFCGWCTLLLRCTTRAKCFESLQNSSHPKIAAFTLSSPEPVWPPDSNLTDCLNSSDTGPNCFHSTYPSTTPMSTPLPDNLLVWAQTLWLNRYVRSQNNRTENQSLNQNPNIKPSEVASEQSADSASEVGLCPSAVKLEPSLVPEEIEFWNATSNATILTLIARNLPPLNVYLCNIQYTESNITQLINATKVNPFNTKEFLLQILCEFSFDRFNFNFNQTCMYS